MAGANAACIAALRSAFAAHADAARAPAMQAYMKSALPFHGIPTPLRCAAFLSQRGRRGAAFDAVLFYDCILPSIGDCPFAGEFFIRKGLGWALRERAHDAPDEVRAFCAEYAGQLSALTKREALRVVGP